MKNIGQDVGDKTAQVAKKTAKRVVQEPLEVLNTAKKQVIPEGTKQSPSASPELITKPEEQITPQEEAKLKEQSKKMIDELEDEIEKIRMQKKQKEEEIKTQEEQEKLARKTQEEQKTLEEPPSKVKSGLAGAKKGMKGKIERLKKKSEIRMPPSG